MAQGNFTKGDVFVANDDNTIARVAPAAAGTALVSNGASQLPSFQTVGGNAARNLSSQTTPANSLGDTDERDLMTFSVAGGTLATNGDRVAFKMVFTFAANATTKRVRVYFGSTTIYDSGAVAVSGGVLVLMGTIARGGATTQRIVVDPDGDFTVISGIPTYTTGSETLSGALTLRATSQQGVGAAPADVSQKIMWADYVPVAA